MSDHDWGFAMNEVDWSSVFSAIAALSALATVVTAWLSVRYTAESWRAQTEPKVIVYVKSDKTRPSILLLVIENIGRDIAHHVTFRPARTLPAQAWGMPGTKIDPAQAMLTGPIATGIPALGPGDSRVITWGQWAGLHAALGDESIEIEYSYNTRSRTIHERSRLEVASFGTTDASESPEAASASHLAKIAQNTESLASSVKEISRYLAKSATKAND